MASSYIEITLQAQQASDEPSAPPLAHVSVGRAPGSVCPEPLDSSAYSFQWTARHDGGALPAVADRGHYALALSSLTEAKATMDLEFQRLLGKAPPAGQGGAGAAGAVGADSAAAAAAAASAGAASGSSGAAAAEDAKGEKEDGRKKARLGQ
jgi:hypothetical protein